MRIRTIEAYTDCGVIIIYSSPEEFKDWASKRSIETYEDLQNIVGYNGKDTIADDEIIQFIWFSATSGRPIEKVIATLAHEATHVVDNIELFIANNPGQGQDERIPREIRARVVEKIVQEGCMMILNKE